MRQTSAAFEANAPGAAADAAGRARAPLPPCAKL